MSYWPLPLLPPDAREKPCTFLHARSPSSLHLPSLDHRSINSTQFSSLRSHTPFIPAVAGTYKQRKRLTVTFSIAPRIIYNLRQIFATRPQMTERHLRLWPGAGTAQSLETLGTDIGYQQHRVFPGHSPATVISSHRLRSAEFPGNLGGRQKPVLMNDRPSSPLRKQQQVFIRKVSEFLYSSTEFLVQWSLHLMFSNTPVSLFFFLETISRVELVDGDQWITALLRRSLASRSFIYLWSTSCTFFIPASPCCLRLAGHKPMTRVRWAQTSSHFSFLSCDHLTKISHGYIFTSVQFSIIKRS